ncbi:hydroxyacid dehydrogenase [Actinocatenispora thailandica]|nr:hydroxyacid dehydrogenase [Actinocatenispora thailandica]
MSRRTYEWLLTPARAARLAELLELPAEPVTDLAAPPARAALAAAEVLVTGWRGPSLPVELPNLRAVFHTAGTVRTLIPDELFDRGVRVVTAADAGAVPVAEYALAAILWANKQVLRSARWYARRRSLAARDDVPAAGNLGKRVGLVGASRVGRRVARLLAPFDVDVHVADPYLTEPDARDLGVTVRELDDLLADCDVVSLHAPATPATRQLFDARRLALLPDGATLINTARGALIDHDALLAELRTGRIDAILDVTDPEPLPPDSPYWTLPNVLLTPHHAGAYNPVEAGRQLDLVLDELARYLRGEPLRHELRPADRARMA